MHKRAPFAGESRSLWTTWFIPGLQHFKFLLNSALSWCPQCQPPLTGRGHRETWPHRLGKTAGALGCVAYSSAALHYGGTKRLSLVNNGPCPGALATCWHRGCPGGARKGMTSAPVTMVTGWSEEASGGVQDLSWTLTSSSDVDQSQLCHSVPIYH